jgi:hypothetical protein
MTTHDIDPNNPLFRKMIQNRFKAFLFGVPSVIGLIFIVVPLDLDFWTEVALVLCCILFGNGVAHYYYAGDLERQFKKEQQKRSSQV